MNFKLPVESNDDRDIVDRRDWSRYHSDLKQVVVRRSTHLFAFLIGEIVLH
jgi:hypothetical protein